MPTLPHAPVRESSPVDGSLARVRAAQEAWAARPIRERLQVLRCFRAEVATGAQELAATVPLSSAGSLHRTLADTLVAEVLPLAEACRFLEREAEFILATRYESSRSRPFWLRSVDVAVERSALGLVLLIGPGNYPLFLPGVQCLQALAAGNAVVWKPAPAGASCAHAMRVMLIASGLPPELLTILDVSPAAATAAIDAGVDKVFLTGSATTGEAVLRATASSATPAVMELSGCDAVFVLPGADLARVIDALAFGLRLNGSATCMAPRRVFVAEAVADTLLSGLEKALISLPPVPAHARTRKQLSDLLSEAVMAGARVVLNGTQTLEYDREALSATLVADVSPEMRLVQSDLFAPVLSVMSYASLEEAGRSYKQCPYALTAAVFGPAKEAQSFGKTLIAGTVLLNDLIVVTADPRVPFGGRKRSGFGATRGREGLLEMTAPRVTVRQRSRSAVPYRPTGEAHGELFLGYLQAAHAKGWSSRLEGLRRMGRAMPKLRDSMKQGSN